MECTVVVLPQGLGTSWKETKDLLASEKKNAASLKVDVEELEMKLEKLAVAPAAGANATEAVVSPIPGGSLPAGVPQIEEVHLKGTRDGGPESARGRRCGGRIVTPRIIAKEHSRLGSYELLLLCFRFTYYYLNP